MKKIVSCFHWVIAIILFVIPFFWFQSGELDLGGDASRLFFYDPWNFLLRADFSGTNQEIGGLFVAKYYLIPFLLFLSCIQLLTLNIPTLMLSAFNGGILSVSFLSVYGTLRELLRDRDDNNVRWASIMAALFFVFSGILVYKWYRYVFEVPASAVFSLIVFLFLRYMRTAQRWYLFAIVFVSLIFSNLFSFENAPYVFSFFPIVGLFVFYTATMEHRVRLFMRGAFFVILGLVLVHAFSIVPLMMDIVNPSSQVSQLIVSEEKRLDRGQKYFNTIAPHVELIYNVVGFHQYGIYTRVGAPPDTLLFMKRYGIDLLWMYFLFPLTIAFGLLFVRRETKEMRRLYLGAVGMLLLVLFLMTANLFGRWGPTFYSSLFYIPGFSMFRSFYGVFGLTYIYIYAIAFGLGMFFIIRVIRLRIVRGVILLFVAGVNIYGGLPLLTGAIANARHDQTQDVSVAHRIPDSFTSILKTVRQNPEDGALASFPLINFNYQILEGMYGGAYVGTPIFPLLAGRTTYGGLGAFDVSGSYLFSQTFLLDRLRANDIRTVRRIFSLLNITTIFNNKNPAVYRDQFVGWPYAAAIWEQFPTIDHFRTLIDALGYVRTASFGPHELFTSPKAALPHIYTPTTFLIAKDRTVVPDLVRSATLTDERFALAVDEPATRDIVATVDINSATTPDIEYIKGGNTRYRIRVHGLRAVTPLVLSRPFHAGWTLVPQPMEKACAWCGLTTAVAQGDAFMSPDRFGTIQNNNLPSVSWTDAWIKGIDKRFHMRMNEGMNGWVLDPDFLQKQYADSVHQNEDGSIDIEFVLVYAPDRFVHIGTGISFITLMIVIARCIQWYGTRRRTVPFSSTV